MPMCILVFFKEGKCKVKNLKINHVSRKFFYLTIAPSIFLALGGCSKNSNNSIATYKEIDGHYEITMTGRREYMGHDPVSILLRKSYSSSRVFFVPRITGEVLGDEIPTEEGYYKYQGRIIFFKNKMIVSIFLINTDDKKIQPISWNGEYHLEKIND
jgi:hypothetical protein